MAESARDSLAAHRRAFPPLDAALDEPNGLLAAGGDLSAERLLDAYRHGIFPWYSEDQPMLWWSPDPRMVLFVDEFRVTRSLRKRGQAAAIRDPRRHGFPRGDARLRASRATAGGHLDHAGDRRCLHASCIGAATRIRSRRGATAAGRRAVRRGDRAHVLRRIDVRREADASKVALVHLVGDARARGRAADRLPAGDRAPRALRRAADPATGSLRRSSRGW